MSTGTCILFRRSTTAGATAAANTSWIESPRTFFLNFSVRTQNLSVSSVQHFRKRAGRKKKTLSRTSSSAAAAAAAAVAAAAAAVATAAAEASSSKSKQQQHSRNRRHSRSRSSRRSGKHRRTSTYTAAQQYVYFSSIYVGLIFEDEKTAPIK